MDCNDGIGCCCECRKAITRLGADEARDREIWPIAHGACYHVARTTGPIPPHIDRRRCLDEGSALHDGFRFGTGNVCICDGPGSRRSAGRFHGPVQGWQLHKCSQEDRRVPRSQGRTDLVRGRRFHKCGKDAERARSGNSARVSTGACSRSCGGARVGSCSVACIVPVVQHRQHGAGSRWRSRTCVGKHADKRLPLPGLPLLRQDQGREVHDGVAGEGRRRASGSWQGLRSITSATLFRSSAASNSGKGVGGRCILAYLRFGQESRRIAF